MVKIILEVSEELAEFLNHPKLTKRHMCISPGQLVEDAFIDVLDNVWGEKGWTIANELKELNKED